MYCGSAFCWHSRIIFSWLSPVWTSVLIDWFDLYLPGFLLPGRRAAWRCPSTSPPPTAPMTGTWRTQDTSFSLTVYLQMAGGGQYYTFRRTSASQSYRKPLGVGPTCYTGSVFRLWWVSGPRRWAPRRRRSCPPTARGWTAPPAGHSAELPHTPCTNLQHWRKEEEIKRKMASFKTRKWTYTWESDSRPVFHNNVWANRRVFPL